MSQDYIQQNFYMQGGGRLVNIMGGTVIETESEKLIRKGSEAGGAKQIIEMGQEFGLDDAVILERLQGKLGLSLKRQQPI